MPKSLVIYSSLSILVLSVPVVSSFSVHAATTLETIISECRQRTGFGDATCKTLVKKHMNVARCKEYTGYSDEECAKKIEEIKRDPEFSIDQEPSNVPSSKPSLPEVPTLKPRDTNVLSSLREGKERDLLALWKRTEAITNILKSKGVDTATIEAAFPDFEKKAEELLAAYDAYLIVYARTQQDTSAVRQSVRWDARSRIREAQRALVDQYQTHILVPIRIAREQVL